MKCEICRADEANAIWQPFGPANTADLFLPTGQHDPSYPAIPACTACRERFQHRLGSLSFTYRRFTYLAVEGRVEMLPDQQLAGRPVKKTDLVGDQIVDVSTTLSLGQDGALVVVEVVVTLASQRRIRYRSDGEGSSLVLPNKYCTWDSQAADDSG